MSTGTWPQLGAPVDMDGQTPLLNAHVRTTTTTASRHFAQGRPCLCVRPACGVTSCRSMEVDGERTSAWRRRQRRLRSWLRHERQTVAMELAAALHHSRDGEPVSHSALRGLKAASSGEEAGVESHNALRGLKTLPPGCGRSSCPKLRGRRGATAQCAAPRWEPLSVPPPAGFEEEERGGGRGEEAGGGVGEGEAEGGDEEEGDGGS